MQSHAKPSHFVTPRQESDGCWIASADPFDWTRQPRTFKPALLWLAALMVVAVIALAVVHTR